MGIDFSLDKATLIGFLFSASLVLPWTTLTLVLPLPCLHLFQLFKFFTFDKMVRKAILILPLSKVLVSSDISPRVLKECDAELTPVRERPFFHCPQGFHHFLETGIGSVCSKEMISLTPLTIALLIFPNARTP